MKYPINDINALYYYAEDMKVARMKVTPNSLMEYIKEKEYAFTEAQKDFLMNYCNRGLGNSEIKLKLKSN